MSRKNFYATTALGTALGLCLAVAPVSVGADTPEAGAEDLSLFAPLVRQCVAEPGIDQCQDVRVLVQDCAEDLNVADCGVMFDEPAEVFEDPEKMERAQLLLQDTAAALDELDMPEPEEVIEDANDGANGETDNADEDEANGEAEDAEDLEESIRAGAERTLLRGDENLMAHSAPELLEGDADAAEAPEDETAIEEDETTAEAESDPLEDDAATEGETVEDAPAEDTAEEQATEEHAEVLEEETRDDEAVDEALSDLAEEAEDMPEARDEVVEGAAEDASEREADERSLDEERERLRTEARELEEERERLRAEAEALAEEAPELVIEDAPEEELVAPADEVRELDEQQRGELDRLLEDPEIAAALGLLGGALAARQADVDRTEDEEERPRDGIAAAIAALERLGRDEDEEDAEEADEAEPEELVVEEVIEDDVTATEVRTSRDDFVSRMSMDFDAGQPRRESRDLERAGLAALGALAVGMIVNQNRVVARSDERIVVQRDDGEYDVWRDDDVILRGEGTTRRIERYADGSTLSRWNRPDGAEIVTIRDATGRVLWRERIEPDGTRIELVNDMREPEPIDVSVLPPRRTRELRITQRTDPELALAMLQEAEAEARALERAFSLRQIRESRELRELVPILSPEPITFETNRASVRQQEAPKLMQVGRLMERLLDENPREIFLVEGHTDATGPASFNLALSDRRAESVALALTEFFDIPPENLVIQGYGERYLRIPTLASEERNRRVAIRRVTPLLGH